MQQSAWDGVVWSQLDGKLQVFFRLDVVPIFYKQFGDSDMRFGVIGLKSDGISERD